jgi:hypothetical protein
MINQKLKSIIGLKIVDATLTIGDAGIGFENGGSLAIYNKFNLTGFSQTEVHLLIVNKTTKVDDKGKTIMISFGGNLSLEIDMREESYTAPEAIQLRIPGEPIVIWN